MIAETLAPITDISLIICTRNRCQQLARCLDSVGRLCFEGDWELIIVDNGSRDETQSVVNEFAAKRLVPTTYVFKGKAGKSNGLNAALRIARGKIFAFTDDDCYPAPDFLDCLSRDLSDERVGYLAGRIMLHDPADERMTVNESTTPLTFPARSFIPTGPVSGANMAFRREVFRDIGGFDPFFGPGASSGAVAEDLDVAGRASAAGWTGLYCPDMVVSHHHGRKAADLPALLKSYGIGIGAYHMKLLLEGHEFRCFVQSMHDLRRRLRASRRSVLWEPVGAAKYARHWLRELRAGRRRSGPQSQFAC
jgi:glycosyltransferase involved in cell wall biosynthesis